MKAARLPIVQDVTAPLVPEKMALIGTGSERRNIDTKTDIVRAPTLTGTKRRGVDVIQPNLHKCYLDITITDHLVCFHLQLFVSPSDPPETDQPILETKSSHHPRRGCRSVRERDGETTRRSVETGRTKSGPFLQTWPGAGNERDPCRTSETGGPAPRSESPGRYEHAMSLI